VVENFSAGTLDRSASGSNLRERSIREWFTFDLWLWRHADVGHGQAMDSIIQALSGLMMTSGEPAIRRSVSVCQSPIYSPQCLRSSVFWPRCGSAR
jgi:hypothetical protein